MTTLTFRCEHTYRTGFQLYAEFAAGTGVTAPVTGSPVGPTNTHAFGVTVRLPIDPELAARAGGGLLLAGR